MNSARAWLTPIVQNFLSPPRRFFWECPTPDSITSQSLPQRKRWLFGTGARRSIAGGRSTGAAAVEPCSRETASLWKSPRSDRQRGNGNRRELSRTKPQQEGFGAQGLSLIYLTMSWPSIPTISGESALLTSGFFGDGCTSWQSWTDIPLCRLLGAGSKLGDAVCPGRSGSGLFNRFSGHFQQ